jgi:serine phosphatase RsbU (regulator of sigma subunit)
VAGDSFDYALNDDVLQVAIIDAMGHGLDAAVMASVAVAAYRHARRLNHELLGLYAAMDRAIVAQFDADRFVTALLACLDVSTGRLSWLNAGHPRPLLLRAGRVVHALRSATALPVGIGGDSPEVTDVMLQPGDRVLFFTDGIIEERLQSGEQFGDSRLVELLERAERQGGPVRDTVRRLSHALLAARGGSTSDDATLFLLEWRGEGVDAR